VRICPECNLETEAEACPKDGFVTVDKAEFERARVDPYLNQTIDGKYRIEGLLGSGGFGAVYRARHVDTGGHIAVKILRNDLTGDQTAIKRFYLEAQNTHKLHHPNTVRMTDFGRLEDGALYIVMEFVRGRNLGALLKTTPRLPLNRCIRIISQILKSLGEAHQHNLIHRDIKPENIMLVDEYGEKDFVKVLDFGIAKSLETSGAQTQGLVGTPHYMAPEQWLSIPPDSRTDIYAVGCLFYQMLAGCMPFATQAQESALAGVMWSHVHGDRIPLSESCPGEFSPALDDLLMAMLAKDPDGRPKNAMDVLQKLDALRLPPEGDIAMGGVDPRVQALIEGETLQGDGPIDQESTQGDPNILGNEAPVLSEDFVGDLQSSPSGTASTGNWWRWTLLVAAISVAAGLAIDGLNLGEPAKRVLHRSETSTEQPPRIKKARNSNTASTTTTEMPETKKGKTVGPPPDGGLPSKTASITDAARPAMADAGSAKPTAKAASANLVHWRVRSQPSNAHVTIVEMNQHIGRTPIDSAIKEQVLKRLKQRTLSLRFRRSGRKDVTWQIQQEDIAEGRLSLNVTLPVYRRIRRKVAPAKPTPSRPKRALPTLRTESGQPTK